jgi:hypothetical protein
MTIYWQHNFFMHFFKPGEKGVSVLLSLHLLPLRAWAVKGTTYRMSRIHERFQFGPFIVEWQDRRTEYTYLGG